MIYESQNFHWHVMKFEKKYVLDYAFEIIIWMSSYSREKGVKHKSIVNFSIYLHMRHPPQIINLLNRWTGITMITLFVHEAAGYENGTDQQGICGIPSYNKLVYNQFVNYTVHWDSILAPVPLTISIEFQIRSKLAVLLFKMCFTDHTEILHTSRQCNCRAVCKISLWSVEHIWN